MDVNLHYGPGSASLFATHARETAPVADHVCCPQCLSDDVEIVGYQRIPGRTVSVYHCNHCGDSFTSKEE